MYTPPFSALPSISSHSSVNRSHMLIKTTLIAIFTILVLLLTSLVFVMNLREANLQLYYLIRINKRALVSS